VKVILCGAIILGVGLGVLPWTSFQAHWIFVGLLTCASTMLVVAVGATAVARDPVVYPSESLGAQPSATYSTPVQGTLSAPVFDLEVPISVERALVRQAIREAPARKRMQYAQLTVYDMNDAAPRDLSTLFTLRDIEQ